MSASCKTTSPVISFNNTLFRAFDFTAENTGTAHMEGPAIDNEGRIFVLNYQKDGSIGLVKPDGTGSFYEELPAKSTGNSIQYFRPGFLLVADSASQNILLVDLLTKRISIYCHNDAFTAVNDMSISRNGQLFVTDPDWKTQTGRIWRINADGSAVLLKENMGTTNGICLSPDGKTLYVNESVQRKVWAFTVNEKGDITTQRLFTTFTDYGIKGMKCDYKGNLYISRYDKGAVAIFNPLGVQIQEVVLKGKKAGNLSFGGGDNKTCFVTLQDRKCIEKFRTDVPGR